MQLDQTREYGAAGRDGRDAGEPIRRIGASHASIVGSVGPVATIFLGALFLGEEVTAVQLGGAALVLAGVLTISVRK